MARRSGAARPVAAVLLMVVASACSGDEEPEPIAYPREADTLVVSYRGSDRVSGDRSYWVYGDRRVILVWIPQDEVGPAPEGVPVEAVSTVVREERMQYYLRGMERVGVLDERSADFGVPEDPWGPLTLYVNTGDVKRQVTYERARDHDPGLNEEQRGDRTFVELHLSGELGSPEDEPYEPASTALLVKSVSGENGRDVREWPLEGLDHAEPWDGNEVVGNRCLIVPSEEAEKITTAMEESEDGVVWRSGGELYQVRPHPLLPHEKDCATVQPYFWP